VPSQAHSRASLSTVARYAWPVIQVRRTRWFHTVGYSSVARPPRFVSSRREAAVRDEYATFDFPKCEKNVVDGTFVVGYRARSTLHHANGRSTSTAGPSQRALHLPST
jgi:hypothetical protein